MKAIAIVAGVAVFAGVSASAATLGGLKTDDLGANSNVVVAHVTGGVSVSFSTIYNSALGYYTVNGVTVTPVAGTFGLGSSIKATLKATGGTSLGEFTGTGVTAAVTGVALTSATTNVAASDVVSVSLVVNGTLFTAAVTATK